MARNLTPCFHPPLSKAVQRCCDARNGIFALLENLQEPTSDNPFYNRELFRQVSGYPFTNYDPVNDADEAFVAAMPPLDTAQDIRDYVSCVLHGLAIGIIDPQVGSRMIAGARIAASLLKDEVAIAKIAAKSQPAPTPIFEKICG